MSVILSKCNESDWIKSTRNLSDVLKMLIPFPSEKMNAYPVSELVNTSEINDISMLNPVGEKLQADFEFQTRIIKPYRMHKEKPHSDLPWFEITRK